MAALRLRRLLVGGRRSREGQFVSNCSDTRFEPQYVFGQLRFGCRSDFAAQDDLTLVFHGHPDTLQAGGLLHGEFRQSCFERRLDGTRCRQPVVKRHFLSRADEGCLIRIGTVATSAILRVEPVIPPIATAPASTAEAAVVSTSPLVLSIASEDALVLACVAAKDAAIVSVRTSLILATEAGLSVGTLTILSPEPRRAGSATARRTKRAGPTQAGRASAPKC